MTTPTATLEDLARVFLGLLRSAKGAAQPRQIEYVIDAIGMLPVLHARSADGELPPIVDGREFREEAAGLLNDVRRAAALSAALLVGRIEDARPEDLDVALEQRSAVQYLADDFGQTAAAGLVGAELFADGADTDLAEKLRTDGPIEFVEPRNVPSSHWWWAVARGDGALGRSEDQ